MPLAAPNSGIRDNHSRGSVGDFLRQQLRPGADLDLVTAYFIRLIGQAVESITATFQQRLATGLQQNRQFVLPTEAEQPQPDSAFESVTWLVVLAPDPAGP